MDFALDEVQELVVRTVRRFVERDVRAWAADADRAAAPPDALTRAGRELGFFTDAVPAGHGGLLEGDYSHLIRALRGYELGRGCAALAALLETNVEPALAIQRWGSDAVRDQVLPTLAAGAGAATARDSRGALTVETDGDDLRISGRIGPAPALGVARWLLLAIDDAALVVLDCDGAGVTRQALRPSGWRAARWGALVCDRARIPGTAVLADRVAAPSAIPEVLTWYRISLASRAAGVAAAAMEHAERYGRDRVQFGQPIGSFESILRLRDDAETGAAAARLMALHAGWLADRAGDEASWAAAADAASRARVLAGDVVARATVDAVQIFGGYGFVNDYPVEKLMRDARAFEALLGDERFDRILAAKGERP